jgi:predicted transcriptional regulator of viral defense system
MLKTLRATAASFLEALAVRNKTLITVDDAVGVTHSNRHQAAVFLGQLARRGILTRLRRGLFAVVPFGKEQEYGNAFLVGSALAGPEPHFISHLGALTFHNLLVQPSRTVHVTVGKAKRSREIGPTRIEFVVVPGARIWGFREEWVTSTDRAPISDLERTLLDGCFRPDLCGGILEVGRALWMSREKLDFNRLLEYVKRFGKFVVAKRIGTLLDVYKLGPEQTREAIQGVGTRSPSYSLLDPILPAEGPYDSRWRLRLNVSPDELLAATRT